MTPTPDTTAPMDKFKHITDPDNIKKAMAASIQDQKRMTAPEPMSVEQILERYRDWILDNMPEPAFGIEQATEQIDALLTEARIDERKMTIGEWNAAGAKYGDAYNKRLYAITRYTQKRIAHLKDKEK